MRNAFLGEQELAKCNSPSAGAAVQGLALPVAVITHLSTVTEWFGLDGPLKIIQFQALFTMFAECGTAGGTGLLPSCLVSGCSCVCLGVTVGAEGLPEPLVAGVSVEL